MPVQRHGPADPFAPAPAYGPAGCVLTPDEAEVFECPGCEKPYAVITELAAAGCLTVGCHRLGELVNVTDAADVYARTNGDPNPAGVRPVREGLPVPWLTPVIGRLTFWRFVHGGRLTDAQERWLCQSCGGGVDEIDGHVIVDAIGRLPTAAPVHERCAHIALRRCPKLPEVGGRLVQAGRADITGAPLNAPDEERDPAGHRAARRPVLELSAPTRAWAISPALLYC